MALSRNILMAWALAGFLMLPACGFTEAHIQKEKSARAHVSLGRDHLLSNQLQDAYVEFQKALEFDPNNRDAHYYLGHIEFERRNYDDAVREFRAVVKHIPDDSEAHNYLGFVLLGQGKIDEAIQEFRLALKNPTYATPEKPRYNLAWAYQRQKKFPEAISEFREAIRVNPAYMQPHFDLGRLLMERGDAPSAIEEFKAILQTFSNDAPTRLELGKAYYAQRRFADARVEFDKVVSLDATGDMAREAKRYLGLMKNVK